MRYFALADDHTVYRIGRGQYLQNMMEGSGVTIQIARTEIDEKGEIFVSTVFLGIDYIDEESNQPPVDIFETMVFMDGEDDYMTRTSTYEDALQEHREVCEYIDHELGKMRGAEARPSEPLILNKRKIRIRNGKRR